MKNVSIKLKIDAKKYNAVQQFMEEKGLDINQELSETVDKLYKKHVPAAVQRYIEMNLHTTDFKTSKKLKKNTSCPVTSIESNSSFSEINGKSSDSYE